MQMDQKLKNEVIKEIKRQQRNRNILVVSLLIVGLLSIGYFVKYYHETIRTERETNKWSELKESDLNTSLSVKPVVRRNYEEDIVIPDILDEYKILYNKNKSLIGWIKIADTNIDYPVMQTVNNDYYLKHNFDQEEDKNGCIFLDKDCDVIRGNTNFIIYGHHMKSGKMFGGLSKYANQDYYEEHKTVTFDTIYEKGTYEVMYAFRSRLYNSDEIVFKYYQFIDANSEEEFNSAMEEMAEMSLIDTGVTAHYGDQLLTLSTCDYQENNGRFAVVCRKIN